MRRDYNKLVRDRIPEIIQASGKRCVNVTMPVAEYRQALLEKLVEEAQEARHAMPDELVTELADLHEVIAAVLAAWQITPERVQQAQRQRLAERGGFEQRLMLLWTEEADSRACADQALSFPWRLALPFAPESASEGCGAILPPRFVDGQPLHPN